MEAAQGGDGEALDALLKQYQPRIFRFGMKMCRDPEDGAGRPPGDPLRRGANAARFPGRLVDLDLALHDRPQLLHQDAASQRLRSGGRLPRNAKRRWREPARDSAPDPERSLADREVAVALESAIAALEPEYREVLLLRDVEGLSAAEVAEVTGLSVAAVKSRLHRARIAVRDRVAPLLEPFAAPAAAGTRRLP